MSYRCEACDGVVREGAKMLRHVVKRPNGETVREVPVCPSCLSKLRKGQTLEAVRVIKEGRRVQPAPPPVEPEQGGDFKFG